MTRSCDRRSVLTAGLAGAALLLTGCTTARSTGPTASGTPSPSGSAAPSATFTLATAARPAGLDPALAVDTESHRITRQVLEGLVGTDPLTSAPVPLLATEWTESEDGRTYTFTLREGVLFHDGEPLNAEAVRANFERWYNLPASARGLEVLSYGAVFNGYADSPELALYEGCEVIDDLTVAVRLRTRMTGFIPAMAAPAFALSSPKALQDGAANELSERRDDVPISRYAQFPVGTGPFTFESWEGDEVRLRSFPDYWGTRGQVEEVVFRAITSPRSRLRALQDGEVDGYDLVTIDDVDELARSGQQLLQRDPYSVLYLGINQNFPGLDELKMRQAIAHAIDKPALLEGLFLNGTKTANQFLPEKLGLTSDSVSSYGHDPEKAKELLAEAGYDGAELPFHYPRHVTRAYLPSPERVYAVLSRQLTAVGLNIRPVPVEWSEGYLEQVQSEGDRALHLLGLSGTYGDPNAFLGPLFGAYSAEFGYEDPQLRTKVERARTLPSGQEQVDAYADIAERISSRVPAVPLAFPVSILAMSPRVTRYPTSPVLNEVYNQIQLAG